MGKEFGALIMSDRNNPCERCGQTPYYEGHLDWCAAMFELEETIHFLKQFLRQKFPTFDMDIEYIEAKSR